LSDGAVHERDTCPFPAVGVGAAGVAGTPAGVTEFEAADVDEPNAFDAVTVNVYAVPLAKPVTTNGEPAPEAVNPPGLEVAVYVGVPVPRLDGSVKATLA
jgi:hypothetical protein